MHASAPQGFTYRFPRPALTVDVVIVTLEVNPRVLLIQRRDDPFAGRWALPGGFVEENEPLDRAALRELKEETQVDGISIQQLGTFGNPGRDPRGWTVTVAYLARVEASALRPRAGDDAAQVEWFPLHQLPPLAFDHAEILALVGRQIESKGS
jgi:8-oxo-dGTP diphosphatase